MLACDQDVYSFLHQEQHHGDIPDFLALKFHLQWSTTGFPVFTLIQL